MCVKHISNASTQQIQINTNSYECGIRVSKNKYKNQF